MATPLSNNYYIASPKGEIYGLDHTAKRFGNPEVMMHLRSETEIPGLILAGEVISATFLLVMSIRALSFGMYVCLHMYICMHVIWDVGA